jgi:CBS domain-containing protein
MATVSDILAVKGSHVLSIGPKATVLDAAVLMNEHKVGSLVVMSGGQLIGIISERDILTRVESQPGGRCRARVQDLSGHWSLLGPPVASVPRVESSRPSIESLGPVDLTHPTPTHCPLMSGGFLLDASQGGGA